jgi:hypothetical protein
MKSAKMIVNGETFSIHFEKDSVGTREISYAAYCIHAKLILNQLGGYKEFSLLYQPSSDKITVLALTPGTTGIRVYNGRVAMSGSECHDFFKRTGVNLLME